MCWPPEILYGLFSQGFRPCVRSGMNSFRSIYFMDSIRHSSEMILFLAKLSTNCSLVDPLIPALRDIVASRPGETPSYTEIPNFKPCTHLNIQLFNQSFSQLNLFIESWMATFMNLSQQYKAMTNNSQFVIRQYVTPAFYCDPRQQIIDRENFDYKNKPKQRKFKPTNKHKPCFMDEQIKPFKINPSPDRYKDMGGFNAPTHSKQRHQSADLKKVDCQIKRGSYIDDIEKFEAKNKRPGVGKYNLAKDLLVKRQHVNLKPSSLPIKFSHMDTTKRLASEVPGSGHYNPHLSVQHLRPNTTDSKFYKAKHANQQKKLKKSLSSKTGPSTYHPITLGTFDSIALKKSAGPSPWNKIDVDLRKGIRSHMKTPSPAEYRLLNQWSARNSRERESKLGKVNIFGRTTASLKTLSVYH